MQVRWDHFSDHTSEKRTLMSTAELANLTQTHDTFNGEKNTGIMTHNATRNPLGDWSKVFLAYCSSDSHAGNRSAGAVAGAGTTRWHFRGKEIVAAVVDTLATTYGLADARAFVLTGGSAGGMATINNADFLADLVRRTAPRAAFVAMPDSGYFMDVQPLKMCSNPGTYECECAAGANSSAGGATDGWHKADWHSWLGTGQTLAQQMQAMHSFTQGEPDASCAAFYGPWGAWRCYLGQYAAPHLASTTLFLQNQIDEWQGFWNGFFDYATARDSWVYMEWFRRESQRTMQAAVAASSKVFLFAPNCYHHGLSYDSIWWEVRVDGWSASSMLAALLDDDTTSAPPNLVVDDCVGLPCSPSTVGQHSDCLPVPMPPMPSQPAA